MKINRVGDVGTTRSPRNRPQTKPIAKIYKSACVLCHLPNAKNVQNSRKAAFVGHWYVFPLPIRIVRLYLSSARFLQPAADNTAVITTEVTVVMDNSKINNSRNRISSNGNGKEAACPRLQMHAKQASAKWWFYWAHWLQSAASSPIPSESPISFLGLSG